MTTDEVKIETWQASGIVLKVPDKQITPKQLMEFAQLAVDQHPNSVIELTEFALRVTTHLRSGDSTPSLFWRD